MSDSVMRIDQVGNKIWKNSRGQYHRIGGPAIEYTNGGCAWFVNGKYHRLNGPSIEYSNGDVSWWVNGKYLGFDDEGFWKLWDTLTPEQKQDPVLLSHLPGDFNV